jgi:hypothetical protein
MTTIDPKILGKIKKCLALSQSSEPHEAAAALRQAQKLMEAHGVDESGLVLADVCEDEVKSLMTVSRIDPNELALVKMVAEAFGCELLWNKSGSWKRSAYGAKEAFGSYTIIGFRHQVSVATHTMVVLMRRHLKARSAFVSTLPSFYSRSEKTQEANGFSHGWVQAVKKMVIAYARGPEEEKALTKYKQLHYPSLTTQKSKGQTRGLGGMLAGTEAGSMEQLHRPVDGGPELKLLK